MKRDGSDDVIAALETVNFTHADSWGVRGGLVLIQHIHVYLPVLDKLGGLVANATKNLS